MSEHPAGIRSSRARCLNSRQVRAVAAILLLDSRVPVEIILIKGSAICFD